MRITKSETLGRQDVEGEPPRAKHQTGGNTPAEHSRDRGSMHIEYHMKGGLFGRRLPRL